MRLRDPLERELDTRQRRGAAEGADRVDPGRETPDGFGIGTGKVLIDGHLGLTPAMILVASGDGTSTGSAAPASRGRIEPLIMTMRAM